MPFARVDTINMHYEVQGTGEPVVLIHDLGSSLADWERQVPVLSRHYKVVTLSLRGFGRSDRSRGPVGIDGLARDVVALMDHLDLPRAHVLGHGLGGAVAFQLATDHPRCVASLMVLNGLPCCELEYWRRHLMVVSRIGAGSGDGMGRIARYVASRLFPEPRQAALRRELYERQRANDRGCYLATLRALAGWSVMGRLHTVKVPVLILAADRDYSPLEEKLAHARPLPDVRFEVIENSRHGTPWDQPTALNRLVLDFVNEVCDGLLPAPGDQPPATGSSAGSPDCPPN